MFFMASIWFKNWNLTYINVALQQLKIMNYLLSLFSPRKNHLSPPFLIQTALLMHDVLEQRGLFIRDVYLWDTTVLLLKYFTFVNVIYTPRIISFRWRKTNYKTCNRLVVPHCKISEVRNCKCYKWLKRGKLILSIQSSFSSLSKFEVSISQKPTSATLLAYLR